MRRRQPFLLQPAERAMGVFVRTLEAGFVAGEEAEGVGLVGESAEGKRKGSSRVGSGRIFHFGLLAHYFAV